jgi:formate dehydrogenase (coenzyme F420) beta subunit
MTENLKTKIKELLASNTIKGFLGLRSHEGHIGPHLFNAPDELENMVIGDWQRPGDSRYPLNKFLIQIACKYPDDTFGVLVRGCDERGLKALYTWNQLNPNKVVAVGVACPQELADACECRKPYPDECIDGQKANACEQKTVLSIDALPVADRFAHWIKEFSKCIKCYGCRDVCPMCFCNECSVGSDDLIHTGHIPPEMPIFHLTRAVHMIGRCIDCGLCNEACPADIPLRTLYKKVADIIDKEFQYRPGYSDQKSPLNVL